MLLNVFIYFYWHFFVVFHHKICVFIILISFLFFLIKYINQHICSILTNQKRELVVQLSLELYAPNA